MIQKRNVNARKYTNCQLDKDGRRVVYSVRCQTLHIKEIEEEAMKKRFLSAFLCLAMAASMLAGCGGSSGSHCGGVGRDPGGDP